LEKIQKQNTPTQNTDTKNRPFALFKLLIQTEMIIAGREINVKSNKHISLLTHDVGRGGDVVLTSFSACFLPVYLLDQLFDPEDD
jgi:hypothetical protein